MLFFCASRFPVPQPHAEGHLDLSVSSIVVAFYCADVSASDDEYVGDSESVSGRTMYSMLEPPPSACCPSAYA